MVGAWVVLRLASDLLMVYGVLHCLVYMLEYVTKVRENRF